MKAASFLENKHKQILTELVSPSKKLEIISFFRRFFNSNSSKKNKRKDISEREIINGEIVRVEGDSYIFVFQTVTDAVKFALIAQARHREVRKGDFSQLHQFRVGIHFGAASVTREKDRIKNISGSEVDLTSRIMSLCSEGQVLCSRVVYENAHLYMKGEKVRGISGDLVWKGYGLYKEKSDTKFEIYEVGEKGISPFKKPRGNEKIWRIGWAQRAVRRWDVRVAITAMLMIGCFVGYLWHNTVPIICEAKLLDNNGKENPLSNATITIENNFHFLNKKVSTISSHIKDGKFGKLIVPDLGIKNIYFNLKIDKSELKKLTNHYLIIKLTYNNKETYSRTIQKLEKEENKIAIRGLSEKSKWKYKKGDTEIIWNIKYNKTKIEIIQEPQTYPLFDEFVFHKKEFNYFIKDGYFSAIFESENKEKDNFDIKCTLQDNDAQIYVKMNRGLYPKDFCFNILKP